MKIVLIILGVGIVLFIAMIYFLTRDDNPFPCSNCKNGQMKYVGREWVSNENTTIDIKREKRNSKGEVIETWEEAVPAVKMNYKKTYRCDSCGKETYKYESETKRK